MTVEYLGTTSDQTMSINKMNQLLNTVSESLKFFGGTDINNTLLNVQEIFPAGHYTLVCSHFTKKVIGLINRAKNTCSRHRLLVMLGSV